MPKRNDIKSILIIGAGPIVIGQACEFDYSGTQALKALKEEGYRVILVNSNPATIMTDPDFADATYIEPITPDYVEQIIAKERPDALLPTMGGQTALNTAMALHKNGVLKKYNVKMIGAKPESIDKAEDRLKFRDAMTKIGLESPKSQIVNNFDEAADALKLVGLPAVIRPSFTLAGTGGGIAYNAQEFDEIIANGLRLSPVHQVLVEESVLGWKEYEMEVVRDSADNCIIICSIENVDPMGVHTGDSITVAPALTLTDKEYQIMRDASIACLREIGVDTGGSNVQFAVNPKDGRMVVIEMNPRVSRSSALASKATGFPIAKVAAKLAVGYTLDELKNDITKVTPASFEPTIDYVVTKIPRFTFEKFPKTPAILGTSMRSVGEVMAIGRNFQESFQKAVRSLETGLNGLNEVMIPGVDGPDGTQLIHQALQVSSPNRFLVVSEAFRHGLTIDEVHQSSKYDPWFLGQIKDIIDTEKKLKQDGLPKTKEALDDLKRMGFSDWRLAQLTDQTEEKVRHLRHKLEVLPVFKRIDTCAGEFASETPYMYSTYESFDNPMRECESNPTDREKIIILGGGPNRIGQGIEFDYCCVHACYALKEAGFETIMINCNPETVSTDYDTSDRLYFEPLTAETVIDIIHREQSNGKVKGVIVQFGGQTPLRLAAALEKADIPILGTTVDAIDLAEDRERFQKLVAKLDLQQPKNGTARSTEEAIKIANDIGYPVLLRPSYVLGGRAMEIVHDEAALKYYMTHAVQASGDNPVLVDSFLRDAIEVDVDVVSDGKEFYVAGVMEHIQEAGIHSGDSACCLPPHSLSSDIISRIRDQSIQFAKALHVVGLMNVQYAVQGDDIYVLEVNPRASRTVPFVAKATGVPIAKIASRVMAGEKLSSFTLPSEDPKHVSVKAVVFPFSRFQGADVLLGPEMKSTGEVMGIDASFAKAFAKAQTAANINLPTKGTAFVSVRDTDKLSMISPVKKLLALGFKVIATSGTATYLREHNLDVETINKVHEGRPHIVDAMLSREVQLVLNTTEGARAIADSFSIRSTALMNSIPYYTTRAEILAAIEAITALRQDTFEVGPLQKYLSQTN